MTEAAFDAKVVDGTLEFQGGISAFVAYLRTIEGASVTVTIEKLYAGRTSQANRRYWGCIVPVAREILSEGRVIPLSKVQTHKVLKYAFLGHEDTPIGPVELPSRRLPSFEFAEYCNQIEHWLYHQYGAVVPERESA